jgi:hypothetical protein
MPFTLIGWFIFLSLVISHQSLIQPLRVGIDYFTKSNRREVADTEALEGSRPEID